MTVIHTQSEPGGHAENEDAFAARAHPRDPECFLVAVADGQGGRAGGARAARLACDRFADAASARTPEELLRRGVWSSLLHEVDCAIADDGQSGFTTLAAFSVSFSVSKPRITGASSGDSAVVLVGADGRAVLTERQFKDPPVGSGGAAFVSFEAGLAPPWTVLAMTDGVWKYAGWEKVFEAARADSAARVAEMLRKEAALARAGALSDDFTLVVVRS